MLAGGFNPPGVESGFFAAGIGSAVPDTRCRAHIRGRLAKGHALS